MRMDRRHASATPAWSAGVLTPPGRRACKLLELRWPRPSNACATKTPTVRRRDPHHVNLLTSPVRRRPCRAAPNCCDRTNTRVRTVRRRARSRSSTARASVIDGVRFEWAKGDVFVVPNWHWRRASESRCEAGVSVLVTDQPVMEKLGMFREQAYPDGDGRSRSPLPSNLAEPHALRPAPWAR